MARSRPPKSDKTKDVHHSKGNVHQVLRRVYASLEKNGYNEVMAYLPGIKLMKFTEHENNGHKSVRLQVGKYLGIIFAYPNDQVLGYSYQTDAYTIMTEENAKYSAAFQPPVPFNWNNDIRMGFKTPMNPRTLALVQFYSLLACHEHKWFDKNIPEPDQGFLCQALETLKADWQFNQLVIKEPHLKAKYQFPDLGSSDEASSVISPPRSRLAAALQTTSALSASGDDMLFAGNVSPPPNSTGSQSPRPTDAGAVLEEIVSSVRERVTTPSLSLDKDNMLSALPLKFKPKIDNNIPWFRRVKRVQELLPDDLKDEEEAKLKAIVCGPDAKAFDLVREYVQEDVLAALSDISIQDRFEKQTDSSFAIIRLHVCNLQDSLEGPIVGKVWALLQPGWDKQFRPNISFVTEKTVEASDEMQTDLILKPNDWDSHQEDLAPVVVACNAANLDEVVAQFMYHFLLARECQVEGWTEDIVPIYPGFLLHLRRLGMRRAKHLQTACALDGHARLKTANTSVPVAVLQAPKPSNNKPGPAHEQSSTMPSPPASLSGNSPRRPAKISGKSGVSRVNSGIIKPRTHNSPSNSSKSGATPRPAQRPRPVAAAKRPNGSQKNAETKLKDPLGPRRDGPRAETNRPIKQLWEEKRENKLRRKALEQALVAAVMEGNEIDKKIENFQETENDVEEEGEDEIGEADEGSEMNKEEEILMY